jgi:hypothetical protein
LPTLVTFSHSLMRRNDGAPAKYCKNAAHSISGRTY